MARRIPPRNRFDDLPINMLEKIITFLPAKDAVRTTLLSRRWLNLWDSVPFHEVKLVDFNDVFEVDENFVSFVGNFLSRARLQHLKSFSIRCREDYGEELLLQWLSDVCTVPVEEVEINLDLDDWLDDEYLRFPEFLRRSTSLRVLKLKGKFSLDLPDDEVCFPNLKILQVFIHNKDDINFTRRLYSKCPVLEDLTIEGTIIDELDAAAPAEFEIAPTTLRKLKIIYDNCSLGSANLTFVIRANNLEHIDFEDNLLAHYILENTGTVIDSAKISIGALSDFITEDEFVYPPNHFQFLTSLSNVKSLVMSSFTIGVLRNFATRHIDDDKDFVRNTLPMFGFLTKLELSFIDCCSWDILSYALPHMPRVEQLVLKKEEISSRFRECTRPWDVPHAVPNCLLQHMKTIEFERFEGKGYEKAVIKYLLENGQVLQRMSIHIWSQSVSTRMIHRNTILAYPKASGECRILFV